MTEPWLAVSAFPIKLVREDVTTISSSFGLSAGAAESASIPAAWAIADTEQKDCKSDRNGDDETVGHVQWPRGYVTCHHEPKPVRRLHPSKLRSFPIGAPRPMCSCMTTTDGRSPGSRVIALRRLPGFPVAEWRSARRLQLRGQPRHWACARTAFPFDPQREPSRSGYTQIAMRQSRCPSCHFTKVDSMARVAANKALVRRSLRQEGETGIRTARGNPAGTELPPQLYVVSRTPK